MKSAGVFAFVPFQAKFEGSVPWLYADILNLITTAIGNLVDPLAAALSLPFMRPDGSRATPEEIAIAWHAVKNDPLCAKRGHLYAKTVRGNEIRLTPDGVGLIVQAKRAQNERILIQRFPDFEDWPVAAQLGVHSWAWACGPAARFPNFEAALRDRDFEAAAIHGHMNDAGPDRIPGNADDNWGLKPRNAANVELFKEAARVQAYHLDPDALGYELPNVPHEVPPESHVQVRQDVVIVDESSRIVHPLDYTWPSYRDAG